MNTSHPDLGSERVEELRVELGLPTRPAAPEPPSTLPVPLRTRIKARVRPFAARLADPVLDRIAELAARRMRVNLRSEYDRLALDVELLRGRLEQIAPALDVVQGMAGGVQLIAAGADAMLQLDALGQNLELLKGELGAFRTTLDELGRAIAPGAGLDGVPERFAELRERVNALDRRTRQVAVPPSSSAASPRSADAAARDSSRFDYVGFERRFRGDPAALVTTLEQRYVRLLELHAPVLDIGCGRGELMALLRQHGVATAGVDTDAGMVDEARAQGLDAHHADAVAFLRDAPPGSFGAITAIHVLEHLQLEALLELIELAATRLRPGGVLVAETPNPATLIVLGNSYVLDPTHVWPLHPSLLTFLCERAGFSSVRVDLYSPAEAYHLPRLDIEPDAPRWMIEVDEALARLNDVLFGPQEYAVIATRSQ